MAHKPRNSWGFGDDYLAHTDVHTTTAVRAQICSFKIASGLGNEASIVIINIFSPSPEGCRSPKSHRLTLGGSRP